MFQKLLSTPISGFDLQSIISWTVYSGTTIGLVKATALVIPTVDNILLLRHKLILQSLALYFGFSVGTGVSGKGIKDKIVF